MTCLSVCNMFVFRPKSDIWSKLVAFPVTNFDAVCVSEFVSVH